MFNLGVVFLILQDEAQMWQCWLYSLRVFAEMGLEYRVRGVLEVLYGQICRFFGEAFFDQALSEERFWRIFEQPLREMERSYGAESVALVLDALMQI